MIARYGDIIAIGGAELEALKQELINRFQDKQILFNGQTMLLTTALQQIQEEAGGHVKIVLSQTLPDPTEPNTQYWVVEYNGETLTEGRFIIITDSLNHAEYVGTSAADFGEFVEKVQESNKLYGTDNAAEQTTYNLRKDISTDYYYCFKDSDDNKRYTKSIQNSASLSAYTITVQNSQVTNIVETTGAKIENGVLVISGVEYTRYAPLDGLYIVNSGTMIASLDAIKSFLNLAGKPTAAQVQELFKDFRSPQSSKYYTGDSAFVYNTSASSGLTMTGDWGTAIPRNMFVQGKMVHLDFHGVGTATANAANWTTIGTVPTGRRPRTRCTILAVIYNNGSSEPAGGDINTNGVVRIWCNAKAAGNNYQVRVSCVYELQDDPVL